MCSCTHTHTPQMVYLVVLETGGLGEAAELGLVGVAEAGLGAVGEEREICKEQ